MHQSSKTLRSSQTIPAKMSTNYDEVMQKLRAGFNSGRTKAMEFRKAQLRAFLKMMDDKNEQFVEALHADLGKPRLESMLVEIGMLKTEIREAIANVEEWGKAEKPKKGFANVLDTVKIKKDPYGVVLIMGAWNYPVILMLKPLVGAIAAGNCALLKPSPVATHAEAVIAENIPAYLDNDCFQVVCGGIPETTKLLKQRFDYIFYTGSPNVGKIVRAASNVYLTPTTLELGGKSPTYVDDTVDFDITAKRLMWGKILNSGQTCIAPDYVLCTSEVEKKLIDACKNAIAQFLGDDPKQSPDYCRIINDAQYERLVKLMGDGKVAMGGECDASARYIAPTILTGVSASNPSMMDEIFGPILPILNISGLNDAIEFINKREKPLALYIFSKSKTAINNLIESTSSGGVCVNDVVMQIVCDNTPFGGVGNSGMGAYNGKYTFDTFSHKKTCLYRDFNAIGEYIASKRYPPYTEKRINLLAKILKKRKRMSVGWIKNVLVFCLGAAVTSAYFYYSKY